MIDINTINRTLLVLATVCVFGMFTSASWMAKAAIDAMNTPAPAPTPTITIEHVITNNVCNRA